MADGVAHLKGHSLAHSPSLDDHSHVVDDLSFFGEALSAGEDEDVDAIFEGVEFVGGEELEEGEVLAEDGEKLSLLGLFAVFFLLLRLHLYLFIAG
jgi:hypothetical protein